MEFESDVFQMWLSTTKNTLNAIVKFFSSVSWILSRSPRISLLMSYSSCSSNMYVSNEFGCNELLLSAFFFRKKQLPYFPANKPIFWTWFFKPNFLGSAYSADTPWTRQYRKLKCHRVSIHSTIVNLQRFALFCTLYYLFTLCSIGTIFACAIKTDKICIFCFKLAPDQSGVAPIKFSFLASLAVVWLNPHFKS